MTETLSGLSVRGGTKAIERIANAVAGWHIRYPGRRCVVVISWRDVETLGWLLDKAGIDRGLRSDEDLPAGEVRIVDAGRAG